MRKMAKFLIEKMDGNIKWRPGVALLKMHSVPYMTDETGQNSEHIISIHGRVQWDLVKRQLSPMTTSSINSKEQALCKTCIDL